MSNRAVVIADYSGKVHAVYPVADTFTYDDLNQVKEKAEYYNQTADLLDIEEVSSCVGEIEIKLRELNGDDDPEPEYEEDLGKCFPVEWDRGYTGGNYNGAGDIAYVPFKLLDGKGEESEQVARAFAAHEGVSSCHIVHYTFDEVYDSEGEEWNNDED